MDCAIYSTTSQKTGIGSINNCFGVLLGYVAPNQAKLGIVYFGLHCLPPLWGQVLIFESLLLGLSMR
jgi:hypothetical protein